MCLTAVHQVAHEAINWLQTSTSPLHMGAYTQHGFFWLGIPGLYLVVNVTICKHGVEVLHTFTGAPVVVMLQALLDGSHVHWVLDNFVIILPGKDKQSSVALPVYSTTKHNLKGRSLLQGVYIREPGCLLKVRKT